MANLIKGLNVQGTEYKIDYESLENKPNLDTKQDKITGTVGQFVVIGSDGNVTTKTVPRAEEASF